MKKYPIEVQDLAWELKNHADSQGVGIVDWFKMSEWLINKNKQKNEQMLHDVKKIAFDRSRLDKAIDILCLHLLGDKERDEHS